MGPHSKSDGGCLTYCLVAVDDLLMWNQLWPTLPHHIYVHLHLHFRCVPPVKSTVTSSPSLPYTFIWTCSWVYAPSASNCHPPSPDFMGYGFEYIYQLNICVVRRLSFVAVPRLELFLFRSFPQLSWKPSAILNQFQYFIDKSCSSFHKTLATSQNLNSTFEGSTMKCQWAWSEWSGSASFSPDLILVQTV